MVVTNPSTRSGSGPTDAALVLAARAREPWAQEALFRRYAVMVNGLAFRLIGRDDELDDLVQDCFAEAWSSLHRLESPGAFGSWLGSIVVRTTHKLLRRRRLLTRLGLRRGAPLDLDQLVSPIAPPDVRAELRSIYRQVESWPAGIRVAFLLRRVEGLPVEQVAEYMALSLATVKRRITQGDRLLGDCTSGEVVGTDAAVDSTPLERGRSL